MITEEKLKKNEENKENEKLKNLEKDILHTNNENDIIELESVEQEKSDHVDEISQTHENNGHRDPHQIPENNADQDATEKKTYKTFETKKELSDYVAKKIKNKVEENITLKTEIDKQNQEILTLKKKVEQLRNVETKSFYQSSTKQEVPKTIEERFKGLP